MDSFIDPVDLDNVEGGAVSEVKLQQSIPPSPANARAWVGVTVASTAKRGEK